MTLLSNAERAAILRKQLADVNRRLEHLRPIVLLLKEQRGMLEMQIARLESVPTTFGAIA
jgi:hypothetical protein